MKLDEELIARANGRDALNNLHQTRMIQELREAMEEIRFRKGPWSKEVTNQLNGLSLLLPVVFGVGGTPNQKGSITRIVNTTKEQKVTTQNLEEYLKRKSRVF